MKKLLSLFLAILMVLSLSAVGFAQSPIGVSADGWNGWSGNATTQSNPITNEDMVMEVDGTAVLEAATRLDGVVMLTVDVYAPNGGTISLKNSKGESAGQLSLANGVINGSETAYNTDGWTTYKIFAMTGTKSYQIYTSASGVDTFVCEGSVDQIVAPTKIEFTGTKMYVDNIRFEKMAKSKPYPDDELTSLYELNLANIDGVVRNDDGWANNQNEEGTETDDNETVSYSRSSFKKVTTSFDGVNAILAKNTGANEDGVSYIGGSNEIYRTANISTNAVFDMKLYIPSTVDGAPNAAVMTFLVRKESPNLGVNIVKLDAANGIYADPSMSFKRENEIPKDEWFDFKIEILQEIQAANIYIGDTKINEWPVDLNNTDDYDGLGALSRFYIRLWNNVAGKGEIYIKDLKISTVDGVSTKTLIDESFDNSTMSFAYTEGYNAAGKTQNMFLESNSTGGERIGVGKLWKNQSDTTSTTHIAVTEDTSLDLVTYSDLSTYKNSDITQAKDRLVPDARYYNSTAMDLKGADVLTLSFDYYSPGIIRQGSSGGSDFAPVDNLKVYFTDSINYEGGYADNYGHPYVYIGDSLTVKDITINSSKELRKESYGDSNPAYKSWHTLSLTVTPDTALQKDIYVGKLDGGDLNNNVSQTEGTLSRDTFEGLKYLSFGVNSKAGGMFYLDNIKVQSITNFGEDYVKSYYVPEEGRCFESDLTREELKELEYAEVRFTNGIKVYGAPYDGRWIDSITIKENRAILADAKIIVGVYTDGKLDAAKMLDYEKDGIYNVAEEKIAANTGSSVRIFYWSMGALNPIDTFDAVDANSQKVNLWVVGDSTAAKYTYDETTQREGWGDFLNEYLKSNEIYVGNEAVGGQSVKRLVDSSDVYDELFGENGKVKSGDYVLISYGINDAKSDDSERHATPFGTGEGTWQWYVQEKLINVIKDKGATPILVTENPECTLVNLGTDDAPDYKLYRESLREYIEAAFAVAEANDISIVDLNGMYTDYLESIGYDEAIKEFAFADNGTDIDHTHPNAIGAKKRAELICKGLKLLNKDISDYVK